MRYPISQFSSNNNLYQKYAPSSLLGCGLLDCHYIVNSNSSAIVVHPVGALKQFIETQTITSKLDRLAVSTHTKIHTSSLWINLVKRPRRNHLVKEVRLPTPYHTTRSSE